jgi:hypothetical protein
MKLGSNVAYALGSVLSVTMNAVFVVSEPSAMVDFITSQGHPQGDSCTGTEIHSRQTASRIGFVTVIHDMAVTTLQFSIQAVR